MNDLARAFVVEAQHYSTLEIVAVASAIAYLLLAIRQHIGCWAFACLSTGIYVFLFIDVRLYMESLLNAFYLAMAIYGFFSWARGAGPGGSLPVTRWPLRRHALAIAGLLALAATSGWFLATRTDAAFPYVDSLTTWSAIWATFLVARKILENWLYWLAIDATSMVVYWERDLALTAALFGVYLVMIPFGYWSWRRSMAGAPG